VHTQFQFFLSAVQLMSHNGSSILHRIQLSSIVSVNGTALKTLLLNYTVDETPKHFMFSGMGSDGFFTMLPTA
jgi:hypothetical protein